MRCGCCNRNLSDYESTLKHPETGNFLDLCKKCIPWTGIKPLEGATKEENNDYEDDFNDEEEFDFDEDNDE